MQIVIKTTYIRMP